jgi:hypothetical protein
LISTAPRLTSQAWVTLVARSEPAHGSPHFPLSISW